MRICSKSVLLARALIWALALLLLPAVPALAADTPDLFGPTIVVQSPPDGAQLTADRPPISASITDSGSGVNPETIRLVLDGIDVTRGCTLQNSADTWTVTFTPMAPLRGGAHRVSLQVADHAGNTSRQEWGFTIAVEPTGPQWHLSGTSTLAFDALPLPRLTENLGLQFDAHFSEHTALNATAGLEWLSPLLIPGEPFDLGTFRLANYAVVLETGPLRTAAGAVEVELPSHALFPLIGSNAIISRLTLTSAAMSTQIAGFAGKMLTSSGFSLSLLNFAGGSLGLSSSAGGTDVYAMVVRTEANNRSGGLALFGIGAPLAGAQTFAECLVTLSPDDVAGYGLATGFTFRGERSGLTAAFLGRDLAFETPLLAGNMAERTRAELHSAGYRVLGRSVLTYSLAGAYGQRAESDAETATVNTDATLRFAASNTLALSARYQGATRFVQDDARLWQETGTHSAAGEILYTSAGQAGGKAQFSLETLFTREGEWAGLKTSGALTQPIGPGNICLSHDLSTRRDAQTDTLSYHASAVLQSAAQQIVLFGFVRLSGVLGLEVQVTEISGSTPESSTAALSFSSKLGLELTNATTLAVDGKYSFSTNGPDYRLKLSLRQAF